MDQPSGLALAWSTRRDPVGVPAVAVSGPFTKTAPAIKVLAPSCHRCVETGATPQSDGVSGLRVVRALEAATESMRNGSVVTPIGKD